MERGLHTAVGGSAAQTAQQRCRVGSCHWAACFQHSLLDVLEVKLHSLSQEHLLEVLEVFHKTLSPTDSTWVDCHMFPWRGTLFAQHVAPLAATRGARRAAGPGTTQGE